MLIRLALWIALLLSFNVPVHAVELTEEQKEAVSQKVNDAVSAAESWLAIIDSGKYMQSWQNASQFFKDKVPDSQWESTMRLVREPLGEVTSREVASVQYLTYIPGAPMGEYVVIQFKTVFTRKGEGVETITPMLESDGTWKVSGYYIK